MTWKVMGAVGVLALAGAIVGGCVPQPVSTGHELLLTPPDVVSVYKLAGRLDMIVTAHSATMVSLYDGRNSVVIFAGTDGPLYVNGQRLTAPQGSVVRTNGMLFVPVDYEPAIRAKLRPLPVPPPRPRWPELAVPANLAGRVVVIDPGHGGKDPGAISVHGDREKVIVLDAARMVAENLTGHGLDARMTRSDDRFIELEERSALANRLRAELFVSVHADAARNRSAQGFTVYVARQPGRASQAAADAIARRLRAAGVFSRGRKEANYRVLVGTTCPAVLVELGYLSNAEEAARLTRPAYRRQLADAIAAAVIDYFQQP